jgi:para-aminobenzoate synthetase/4-amino-4-deoxychorismate lyase
MAIIKQIECEPRGIYGGAIGLLAPHGEVVFSVAIRTLVVNAATGAASFRVESAVTSDSTIKGDYEEWRHKPAFLAHV